jgi:hypothetical protein
MGGMLEINCLGKESSVRNARVRNSTKLEAFITIRKYNFQVIIISHPTAQFVHHSNNATFTPPKGLITISVTIRGASPPGCLHSTLAKACKSLTVVYPISVSANCCPRHILGPPLKGI